MNLSICSASQAGRESRSFKNIRLTVRRTQPPFFILAQLHVSVVFDHHRAINTILQSKVKNALQIYIYILWDPTSLQKILHYKIVYNCKKLVVD